MATFTVDPTDPQMVVAPNGRKLPRSAVAPQDIVASPAAPSGAPPTAPGMTPRAQSLLNDVNTVTEPLRVASQTRNVQRGIAPSQLNPVLQSNTESTESLASTIEQQGAAKTERETQRLSSAIETTEQDRAKALRDEADAKQRGEIARLNGLAIAAQEDPEIDPGRFVDNMSTGRKIGLIITAAITGAVAGIQGRAGEPNPVVGMLMNAIDQDIAAQKEAIASGRIRRGNMIQWFRDQGMTEKDAEIAARGVATNMAARKFELEGELSKAPEFAENARVMAQQMRAQTEQHNNELKLSLGTDRVSESTTKEPPKSSDGLESFTKQLAARKAYEEAGATPEQLADFDKALGIPAPAGKSKAQLDREKPSAEQEKRANQLASLDNLAKQLDALPADTHSRSTEFLGTRVAKGAADVLFGEGAGDVGMSDQEKADRQVFEQAVNQYASLQSQALGQGALAGPEFDRAKAAAYAMGPRELARAIRSFRTTISGPGAVQDIQVEDR